MADIDEKWGSAVAERGFAQIPNYLLLINQFLDGDHRLTPGELLVLLQLTASWWKKDDLPFPSVETLATRCGISSRQVQRALVKLEGLNLVRRVQRRTRGIIASNAYDLSPLVEFLGEVAKAFPNEFPRRLGPVQAQRLRAGLIRPAAPSQPAQEVLPKSAGRLRLAKSPKPPTT